MNGPGLFSRTCVSCALAVGGAFLLPPAQSFAQIQYNTIALSGEPAPGTPAGVSYSSFPNVTLNDAGQVAFRATLAGTGVTTENDIAVFAGAFANPQLVAREGDAAPGAAAGVSYVTLADAVSINDAGQIAYRAFLTGSPGAALYAGGFAAPQLLARAGDPAPGMSAGVTYLNFSPTPLLNDAGQLAYNCILAGTGVTTDNRTALYGGPLANPQLVARNGNPAAALPAGVSYASNKLFLVNDAGQIGFHTRLTGTGVTSDNDVALYAGAFASPQLVARTGNHAPGTPAGVNYRSSSFSDPPTLNDAGQLAFTSFLTGTGVIEGTNNLALFAGSIANPQLVARTGDPAPGTGLPYYTVSLLPAINDVGQVAYTAIVGHADAPLTPFDFALFAGDFANPQLIALDGDQAPGTPAGVVYDGIGLRAFNDAGQLAYVASLSGPGVTDTNDVALYAFDPVLGDLLIARSGDVFDVGAGDLRTIADAGIGICTSRNDDTPTQLSNDGTLAFTLTFTDGTTGVFSTVLPEPASLALALPAVLALTNRHRRRTLSNPHHAAPPRS